MKVKKDSNYVVVKGSMSYDDEFNIEFISVMEKTRWEHLDNNAKRLFEKIGTQVEFYFGINESVFFDDYDSWISKITVAVINSLEAASLIRYVGPSFGTSFADYNFIEQLMDQAGEQPNTN